MNIPPDLMQTLVYFGLVIAGMLLKQFFPQIKLPAIPTPTPIEPAKPSPQPDANNLRELLAEILPGLLEQFLKRRSPVQTLEGGSLPRSFAVTTATHDVIVNDSGVSVMLKQ